MSLAVVPAQPAQPEARRILPHNLEAEEAVIGGILFAGRAIAQVAEFLEPRDFYHPALQAIYEAMLDLDLQAKPIDVITVAEQMRLAGSFAKLKAYHGEAYLADLSTKVATVDNLVYYGQLVRQKATARALIEVGSWMVGAGYREQLDVDRYLDESQQAIFKVAHRGAKQSYEFVKPLLRGVLTALERRYERKEAITGVSTGYTKLDDMSAGFQPADLVIIAARPSMGKTAFAMNCAMHAALERDVPVLVFTLEMSKDALLERVLSTEGRVDSQRLRSGFLESRDWINLTKAAQRISQASLAIDEGASTLMEIRARARRWRSDSKAFARKQEMGLVVIDYLQLIQGRLGPKASREQEISDISRGLKALAKELHVPIVALSQLNRSVESRADKRPMASDLRESGALEQDADVICFIYRDEVYNKDTSDQGIAEIIIGKQRNGPTGTVRLAFQRQYVAFENLAEDRYAAQ